MPLPELMVGGPDMSGVFQNALMLKQYQDGQANRNQMMDMQQQALEYKNKLLEFDAKNAERKAHIDAFSSAIGKAKTGDEFQSIYSGYLQSAGISAKPEEVPNVEISGEKRTVTLGDGTKVSAYDPLILSAAAQTILKDPSAAENPHFWARLAEKGVEFEMPQQVKAAPQWLHDTASDTFRFVDPIHGKMYAQTDPGVRPFNKGQTINVSTGNLAGATRRKASEEYGAGVGRRVNERIDGAFEAQDQNNQLDIIIDAIKNGAKTGFGQDVILSIRSAAKAIGFDVGDISGQELVKALSNQMALRVGNPKSGLGLKGATSNIDLKLLLNSVTGLSKTESGNIMLAEVMKAINNAKIKIVRKQSEIIKLNNGEVPEDLDSQLLEYANSMEIIDEDFKKEIKRLTQPIRRTGMLNGRKVVEFEDGSIEYAAE